MAKLKLDSDIAPEVGLIAISSHVNDYRLCWALNKALDIRLARRRSEIEQRGPRAIARFPAFDHLDDTGQATITLVCNHAPEGLLMPEERKADFFLLLDNECALVPGEALAMVRQAEFVLMAYPLEITALKDGFKLLQ